MNGYIKVAPEQLTSMSNEFASESNMIYNLTSEMLNLISATYSIWQGEAATAYTNKFSGLQEDMEQMYRMIQEHSADLEQMAANYKQSESNNVSEAMALLNDVIH